MEGTGNPPVDTPIEVNDQVLEAVRAKGYVVRNAEQENSYVKTKVDDAIKTRDKDFYTGFDTTIKEVSEVDKNDQEKTADYAKRAIESWKSKYSDTNTELEKIKANGIGADEVVAQKEKVIKELQGQIKAKTTELETRDKQISTDKFNNQVDSVIQEAMSRIRPTLKKFEDDSITTDIVNNRITSFLQSVDIKEENGVIIFNDKEGNPLINKVDGNYLSAYDLLSVQFENVIDKDRKISGLGSQDQTGGSGADEKDVIAIDTKVITTQLLLHEYLVKELKLDPSNPEFTRKYQATKAKYKIEKIK